MKKRTAYNYKITYHWLLAVVVLIINSCISLVSSYDVQVKQQIESISKEVDRFYLEMLENTSSEKEGRAYQKFSKEYVKIEVELNALLTKNKVRPLNTNSTRICEITLQLWIKYKEEHKTDNTLSNGLIKLNRKTFNDLFFAMQVAEEGKMYKLTNQN